MLKGIKSNYIIQYIFFLLNQNRKLKLVKYNKNLQNKLTINLDDYKNLSRKYIIFEKNEKKKNINMIIN